MSCKVPFKAPFLNGTWKLVVVISLEYIISSYPEVKSDISGAEREDRLIITAEMSPWGQCHS